MPNGGAGGPITVEQGMEAVSRAYQEMEAQRRLAHERMLAERKEALESAKAETAAIEEKKAVATSIFGGISRVLTEGQQAFRELTKRLSQSSWGSFLSFPYPTFILGLLYLDIHLIARYVAQSNWFCFFGEETLPPGVTLKSPGVPEFNKIDSVARPGMLAFANIVAGLIIVSFFAIIYLFFVDPCKLAEFGVVGPATAGATREAFVATCRAATSITGALQSLGVL